MTTTEPAPAEIVTLLRGITDQFRGNPGEVSVYRVLLDKQRHARDIQDDHWENRVGEILQAFADSTTLVMDVDDAHAEALQR